MSHNCGPGDLVAQWWAQRSHRTIVGSEISHRTIVGPGISLPNCGPSDAKFLLACQPDGFASLVGAHGAAAAL